MPEITIETNAKHPDRTLITFPKNEHNLEIIETVADLKKWKQCLDEEQQDQIKTPSRSFQIGGSAAINLLSGKNPLDEKSAPQQQSR